MINQIPNDRLKEQGGKVGKEHEPTLDELYSYYYETIGRDIEIKKRLDDMVWEWKAKIQHKDIDDLKI